MKGGNYGTLLQEEVKHYYDHNNSKCNISAVDCNTDPMNSDPDITLHFIDGNKEGIEVKSCKNQELSGVTICNSPELLNSSRAFLINYTFNDEKKLEVKEVFDTELHRLATIKKRGKYKGCLTSTRDTGKKIKGRSYNDFVNTNECDDHTLAELTDPAIVRKTILYFSASKLVDDNYDFTDDEILNAIHELKKR